MGLGLLILTSIGKENIYLSMQPEITFFKIVYKRYTNFSMETIPQYFKSTPDFGTKCSVVINKNADLLGMTYLLVELPDIDSNLDFKWVDKIGYALINNIEIELEGNIIDKHYGDWLNIWFELTKSPGHIRGLNKIIGNDKNITNNNNVKSNTILYIPFCFWFCLDTGLALPLISLINSDIIINVEFNNLELCYKLSPSKYILINENICCYDPGEYLLQNNVIIGEFISYEQSTGKLKYNQIQNAFTDTAPIIGMKSNLKITMKKNIIINNNNENNINKSLINAYIIVNYIYIDNFEREYFINQSYEYIIQIIQTLPEQIINTTNNIYKLSLFNPIKLIIWRGVLLSNININNKFNYCDINNDNLINKNLIIINSVNRMDLNSIIYYTNLQKYQYNFNNSQNGIYMYSFSLNPNDLQPSGSLNFSKIDDAYIQFTMNKNINYQNPVNFRCYAIQYNILKINKGIGGLYFYN
jgi:hypothetical protein